MKISRTLHQCGSAPFIALFPALVGLAAIAVKQTLEKLFEHTSPSFINDEYQLSSSLSQKEVLWLIQLIYKVFKSIEETIFASYNNYFTFMLMMVLVNIILQGSKGIKRSFGIKEEHNQTHFAQDSADKGRKTFLKSFLIYSLIFCFYQVIWNSIAGLLSSGFLHEALINPLKIQNYVSGRVLEEQLLIDQLNNNGDLVKKPSLSIGKVISEIDVIAYSMKLSKDGKTLFAATNYPPALKIIDVSESQYPVILSSLPLTKGLTDVIYKSMIVSPDGTKIFISNFEYLEIVDISDLKSPLYLAKIQDEIIFNSELDNQMDEASEPNLLLSKDGKFLFVSGFGLQIFDISDLRASALVSSVPSRLDSYKLLPSSIALSQDGKTLYYTDGSFWIYNVEDPKELRVISSFNLTTSLISSMILSKDYKMAFVLSLDEESKILLQKLDISDIHSIKEGERIQLDQVSTQNPVFLNSTPDTALLLIRFASTEQGLLHKLLVFDTQERRIVNHGKMFLGKNDISVLFAEDYKKMFIGTEYKLKIVDLYLDFPNKNAFSNSSNIIQTLNTQMEFWKASLAPSNENILYSVYEKRFGIHKLSAGFDQFANISFYEAAAKIEQMVISQDNKRAFLMSLKTVYILDISNPGNITLMGKYRGGEEEKLSEMESFLLSRDGQTGFLVQTFSDNRYLEILDVSDPKSPMKKGFIDLGEEDERVAAVLSKDGRTLFIASRNINVYNVSDHSSPTLLTLSRQMIPQENSLKILSFLQFYDAQDRACWKVPRLGHWIETPFTCIFEKLELLNISERVNEDPFSWG